MKNPYAKITLYPCKLCLGWHIGNKFNKQDAKWSLNRLTRMMSHPNFFLKAPEDVQSFLLKKRNRMEGFLANDRRLDTGAGAILPSV